MGLLQVYLFGELKIFCFFTSINILDIHCLIVDIIKVPAVMDFLRRLPILILEQLSEKKNLN